MEKQFQEPDIRDADGFLMQLSRVPKEELSIGRILTIGFISGLNAAEATQATKLEAASK